MTPVQRRDGVRRARCVVEAPVSLTLVVVTHAALCPSGRLSTSCAVRMAAVRRPRRHAAALDACGRATLVRGDARPPGRRRVPLRREDVRTTLRPDGPLATAARLLGTCSRGKDVPARRELRARVSSELRVSDGP